MGEKMGREIWIVRHYTREIRGTRRVHGIRRFHAGSGAESGESIGESGRGIDFSFSPAGTVEQHQRGNGSGGAGSSKPGNGKVTLSAFLGGFQISRRRRRGSVGAR